MSPHPGRFRRIIPRTEDGGEHSGLPRIRLVLSRALTLSETLAIVSVVSLLLCILLPALATTTRDPTRRIMCADNMRRLMEGVFSYASDHQGKGPIRGWFSYDIAARSSSMYGWGGSTKVFSNLGMLHSKWTGGEHNRLYCPATYTTVRDSSSYGWETVKDPTVWYSVGSHNYAIPLSRASRASPMFTGADPFPQAFWASDFITWVETVWQPRSPTSTFAIPDSPALAFDAVVGGLATPHALGINVMYVDGHVRYHELGRDSVSNTDGFDLWYKVSLKQ